MLEYWVSQFRGWSRQTIERIERDGVAGLLTSVYILLTVPYRELSKLYCDYRATPIFEQNWDVLIILDGCRTDVIEAVEPNYPFLESNETAYSVGSCSGEWMNKNFVSEYAKEMEKTAYVTGNPFTNTELDEGDFRVVDAVWKYAWDEELGTIPPNSITDRAIDVGRETDAERLIVHYMQPHFPSVPRPAVGSQIDLDEVGSGWENSVWMKLKRNEVTASRVWDAYQENLRCVLDSVERLLDNIDAERVIISSDHGNAFGEVGVFGHPCGYGLRCLRRVPWYVTSAKDERTREPKTEWRETEEENVHSRLEDLGYL